MPTETYTWYWDEAFCKFGFDDGDGPRHTYEVITFIDSNTEYRAHQRMSSIHNEWITEIEDKDGNEIECDGYTDPRDILPQDLLIALNERFGPAGVF